MYFTIWEIPFITSYCSVTRIKVQNEGIYTLLLNPDWLFSHALLVGISVLTCWSPLSIFCLFFRNGSGGIFGWRARFCFMAEITRSVYLAYKYVCTDSWFLLITATSTVHALHSYWCHRIKCSSQKLTINYDKLPMCRTKYNWWLGDVVS